jgi:hypothetical protein
MNNLIKELTQLQSEIDDLKEKLSDKEYVSLSTRMKELYFLIKNNVEIPPEGSIAGDLSESEEEELEHRWDNRVIRFGKYRGELFRHVFDTDRSYVGWVLSLEDVNRPLTDFHRYCEEMVEMESC